MFESHPDCARCNNRGKLFSPTELNALMPVPPPAISIAEEWGENIAAAAAVDVDVLVEEWDRVSKECGAAAVFKQRAPLDSRVEANRLFDAWIEERERVGKRLTDARVRYHALMKAETGRRQTTKYEQSVAAQSAAFEARQDEDRKDRTRMLDRFRPATKATS